MAIMVIISIVFLVRQNRFDSSTVLRSLAYSVALSVRQAQVYGTSVLGTTTAAVNCTGGFYSTTQGSCYAAAYGLYFDSSTLTSYTLFADLNNDGQYESNEVIKVFQLGTGYSISDFGAVVVGGSVTRSLGLGTATNLTIVFKRPNPDACIATNVAANACQSGAAPVETYTQAYVRLQANGDPTNTKRVNILTTGEVDVCTTVGC